MKDISNIPFEEKFEYLMWEDGRSGNMERYYAARKMINEELGLHMGGYYPFSQQKAISVRMYKNSEESFQQTYESLRKILPLMKPMNAEGEKRFGVFEYTLSEYGVFGLVEGKRGWRLDKTVYGSTHVEQDFGSLEEALRYVQQNHYYEEDMDEVEAESVKQFYKQLEQGLS